MIYDAPDRASRLAQHRSEEKALLGQLLKEALPAADELRDEQFAEQRERRPILGIRA